MDEYKRSLRVENAAGPITYNQHDHHYPTPPPAPHKPDRWRLVAGIVAALALGGGGLATAHLNSKVYYCASRNSVKYHTDATCLGLRLCSYKIKSMSLSQARSKMELCKMCH